MVRISKVMYQITRLISKARTIITKLNKCQYRFSIPRPMKTVGCIKSHSSYPWPIVVCQELQKHIIQLYQYYLLYQMFYCSSKCRNAYFKNWLLMLSLLARFLCYGFRLIIFAEDSDQCICVLYCTYDSALDYHTFLTSYCKMRKITDMIFLKSYVQNDNTIQRYRIQHYHSADWNVGVFCLAPHTRHVICVNSKRRSYLVEAHGNLGYCYSKIDD